MIVPLIPLILAASINVNESDWKYGPEVIYDTKIDGQSPLVDMSGAVTLTFNTTMKLACRPKSELVLSCVFYEPTTVVSQWDVDDDHTMKQMRKYPAAIPEATSFEFNFDSKIKRPIVVTSSIDAARLNIVRALVELLNVAANFSTETSHIFDAVRHTNVGSCKVRYDTRSRKVHDEEDAKKSEKNAHFWHLAEAPKARREEDAEGNVRLSMIALPDEKPIQGEVREIYRSTDLQGCTPMNYASRGVSRKLKSSRSHAIVTESNFTSYSDYEVIFTQDAPHRHSTSSGSERITITLDKVVPASVPLSPISDPITFGIQATKVFHSDSTLDSSENKLYDRWLSLADYVNKKSNQENNRQSVTQ